MGEAQAGVTLDRGEGQRATTIILAVGEGIPAIIIYHCSITNLPFLTQPDTNCRVTVLDSHPTPPAPDSVPTEAGYRAVSGKWVRPTATTWMMRPQAPTTNEPLFYKPAPLALPGPTGSDILCHCET
jgi:hypothetical protein